jgi:hypothetical protein
MVIPLNIKNSEPLHRTMHNSLNIFHVQSSSKKLNTQVGNKNDEMNTQNYWVFRLCPLSAF